VDYVKGPNSGFSKRQMHLRPVEKKGADVSLFLDTSFATQNWKKKTKSKLPHHGENFRRRRAQSINKKGALKRERGGGDLPS